MVGNNHGNSIRQKTFNFNTIDTFAVWKAFRFVSSWIYNFRLNSI